MRFEIEANIKQKHLFAVEAQSAVEAQALALDQISNGRDADQISIDVDVQATAGMSRP
jgi:hypothetical protein